MALIIGKAVYKPLIENATAPIIQPKAIISHSAVDAPGVTDLWKYFNQTTVTVESHFWVRRGGVYEQFMDTNRRADANYKANGWAISIETEDEGDPNNLAWDDGQLDALHDIHVACMRVYPAITHRICPSWTESGIGYHSQFPEWSTVKGKTCPGTIRVLQWKTELVPQIFKTLQGDIPVAALTTDQAIKLVNALYAVLLERAGDPAGVAHWTGVFVNKGAITGLLEFVQASADERFAAGVRLESRLSALEAAVKANAVQQTADVEFVIDEIVRRLNP